MNESHITVHGYVAATPTVRQVGEHSVANFRIGVTPRRLEKRPGSGTTPRHSGTRSAPGGR